MELTQQDGDTNDFLVPLNFGDYMCMCLCPVWLDQLVSLA